MTPMTPSRSRGCLRWLAALPPVMRAYTALNDGNVRDAADLWVSNPTAATAEYGDISQWDLRAVTTTEKMWCGHPSESGCSSAKQAFNGDLSSWDVSRVTNMYRSK